MMGRKLRVVYYTRPPFLDTALPFIREMSRLVELHLLVEVSPDGWQSSLFDVAPRPLPSGIVPADPVLEGCFPAGVRACWRNTASFNLVVHNCSRSIHPATWWVGHKAVRFIKELKPDLLHLDETSSRVTWSLLELGRLPIVFNVHDPEFHSEQRNWRSRLDRSVTFPRVKHFLLRNRAQRDAFCAGYGLAAVGVDVIQLGICDVFREWATGPAVMDERNVLFFGRRSPYKGLDVLYEAASAVAARIPGVRFTVAGRAESGFQPQLAPALPRGGQIEVIDGYISNSRLASLFQRASVVVCPYTEATQSGVVLTAYAFGKSVVATRVGGIPEYVQDGLTGLLVPPGDPKLLADTLVRLLGDPTLRRQLEAGVARISVNGLDWASIAGQMQDVYRRVALETRL
jgi:glycosyltransferase involved in cell wall biosynthesis